MKECENQKAVKLPRISRFGYYDISRLASIIKP